MSIDEKKRWEYAYASAYLRIQLTRTCAVLRDRTVRNEVLIPDDWSLEDMEEAVEIAIALCSAINVSYEINEHTSQKQRIEEILDEVYDETT